MILEVKGQVKEQDHAKWAAAKEWVEAVNLNGNFGMWGFGVIEDPQDIFSSIADWLNQNPIEKREEKSE